MVICDGCQDETKEASSRTIHFGLSCVYVDSCIDCLGELQHIAAETSRQLNQLIGKVVKDALEFWKLGALNTRVDIRLMANFTEEETQESRATGNGTAVET